MENNYFEEYIKVKAYTIKIQVPNICPHCNKSIKADVLGFHGISEEKFNELQNKKTSFLNIAIPLLCTACKKYFIQPYRLTYSNYNFFTVPLKYEANYNIEYTLPEELESVSEEFKKIYSQALVAEKMNLNLIAGVGIRKSVEFLVKDYLINLQNEDKEIISKKPLSQAINMIDNSKIKALALAVTWLGNDETHYERKYTDKDINDMKRFIKALAYHVASEIHASEAGDFISENK